MSTERFLIRDFHDSYPDLAGRITIRNDMILIGFDGYGEANAIEGTPIAIEQNQGTVILYVWSDINDESPTHIIHLEKAKVQYRSGVVDEKYDG